MATTSRPQCERFIPRFFWLDTRLELVSSMTLSLRQLVINTMKSSVYHFAQNSSPGSIFDPFSILIQVSMTKFSANDMRIILAPRSHVP